MTTDDPSRTAALFRRYADTFATRDVDRIAALHAEDGLFWLHTDLPPVRGRAGIRAAFAALFEQWPELGFVQNRVILGPDHWVLDWDLTAVPGGRAVRFACLDVVDVDAAGLVTSKVTWVDSAQARRAAGAPTG